MIKKVVPSGGGQCIAPSLVEACDLPKRGRLGCTIFDSGGLRSRNPLGRTALTFNCMILTEQVENDLMSEACHAIFLSP